MPKEGKFRSATPLGTCATHEYPGKTGPRIPPTPPPPKKKDNAHIFIIVDEVLPSKKLVRKVIVLPITEAEVKASLPEKYGIAPKNPNSTVSIGEHALGKTDSRYTSASSHLEGAPTFSGRPVYIDEAKVKASGAKIFSTQEIEADLDRLLQADQTLKSRIERLRKAIHVEGEVLIEGNVPASAIKSAAEMAKEVKLTQGVAQGLRYVQAVGFVMSAYDVGKATGESVKTKSVKPIAAETIRQVGGWRTAVAGAEVGAEIGAALGIETGPGALLSGAVGALIFGTMGYLGSDIVADMIHEN